jgi:hypothetical protein
MSPTSSPRGNGHPARHTAQTLIRRISFIALLILTGVIGATSAPTYAAGPLGPLSTRQQTPTATPPPGPGCSDIPHAGDLRAVITDHPDSTTALFTNRSDTCSYRIGLAIYKKFDDNIDHQEL